MRWSSWSQLRAIFLGQAIYQSKTKDLVGSFLPRKSTWIRLTLVIYLLKLSQNVSLTISRNWIQLLEFLIKKATGFGGLTIDLYGDYAVFLFYNAFVYQIRELLVTAFQEVFPEGLGRI